MALPPLTHHEIMGLVEPFTRRGRRVDLEASDRIERRLHFAPIEHADKGPGSSTLREELVLENPYKRAFELTRVLTTTDGVQARLVAEGPDPGELLDLVESIAPEKQLGFGTGFVIAHHHQVEPSPGGAGAGALLLVQSVVKTAELKLTLTMPTAKRRPAEIEMVAEPGDPLELPEDLLAVLGWDWAPLKQRDAGCWRSRLRLRGQGPDKSRRAEAKLENTARHLAQTLAEPPQRFHERLSAARWGAMLRRLIPLLSAVLLVVVALMLPAQAIKARPVLLILLFNAPVLVIGFAMTLQEEARIEFPPLPRPATRRTWRTAPGPVE